MKHEKMRSLPRIGKPPPDFSNVWKNAAFALVILALAGCGKPPATTPAPAPARLDPARFDGQAAYQEAARFVGLGPKDAATDGAANAARYLLQRLNAMGLEASIDEFTDLTPKGQATLRNVIGEKKGTGGGIVIVGSHYDTKSGIGKGFEGANDSASSTAALLELARVIAESPALPVTVRVVFLDGEECMEHYGPRDGLHGSRHMVKQLVEGGTARDVLAFILLDMVGDKDLTISIPRNGTADLVTAAFQAAAEEGARTKFSLFPGEIGDDHEPFWLAGIPAVDLIDYYYGSAPGLNDYWHTTNDRMDKISAESLQIVGRVVIRMVNRLAGGAN